MIRCAALRLIERVLLKPHSFYMGCSARTGRRGDPVARATLHQEYVELKSRCQKDCLSLTCPTGCSRV